MLNINIYIYIYVCYTYIYVAKYVSKIIQESRDLEISLDWTGEMNICSFI